MTEFVIFLIISIAGLSLFAFTELLYHRFGVKAEITRKTAHVGSGLLSMLFPVYFHSQWWVLLICAVFQLLLVLSSSHGFLKSINAVPRKTYGSIVYPIVVYIVYLAWFYTEKKNIGQNNTYVYFYLPILIMAICDPIATLVGRIFPLYKFIKLNKSLGGSLAFWAGAFIISSIFLVKSPIFNQMDIAWVAVFIATISSVTELYSKKGLDNLFIPIIVLLTMYVVEYFF